jgi:uncharacterized membrane protein
LIKKPLKGWILKTQRTEGAEHVIFTLSLTFVLILGTLVYTYFSPREKSKFVEISVLDDGNVSNVFKGIGVGEAVNLTLLINNKCGREIKTIIELKLGNETTETPLLHNSIRFFEGVIQNEEQREIPLTLRIEEVVVEDRYVSISEISVNGESHGTEDVSSINGTNFRFIFSIFEYNGDVGSFGNTNQLWNQIWFNLTTT